MSIFRTIIIDDITPQELAELFLAMDGERQAQFFGAFKAITDTWPGAGWCQQSCAISEHLDPSGIEAIQKLAEWASDPYRSPLNPDHTAKELKL